MSALKTPRYQSGLHSSLFLPLLSPPLCCGVDGVGGVVDAGTSMRCTDTSFDCTSRSPRLIHHHSHHHSLQQLLALPMLLFPPLSNAPLWMSASSRVCQLPVSYPVSPFEVVLPELVHRTVKMYRGGKICLSAHFKPLWAKNVPHFGIAHELAMGVRRTHTAPHSPTTQLTHPTSDMASDIPSNTDPAWVLLCVVLCVGAGSAGSVAGCRDSTSGG